MAKLNLTKKKKWIIVGGSALLAIMIFFSLGKDNTEVIKGETDHYDLVAWEAARGIGDVALTAGIPVIFGVLATHTVELARDRAGGRQGNAGYNCALTAVEMGTLMKKL